MRLSLPLNESRISHPCLYAKKKAALMGQPLLFCFLVSLFTIPVTEITTGTERLLLCLGLRPLNDNLTAVEL